MRFADEAIAVPSEFPEQGGHSSFMDWLAKLVAVADHIFVIRTYPQVEKSIKRHLVNGLQIYVLPPKQVVQDFPGSVSSWEQALKTFFEKSKSSLAKDSAQLKSLAKELQKAHPRPIELVDVCAEMLLHQLPCTVSYRTRYHYIGTSQEPCFPCQVVFQEWNKISTPLSISPISGELKTSKSELKRIFVQSTSGGELEGPWALPSDFKGAKGLEKRIVEVILGRLRER